MNIILFIRTVHIIKTVSRIIFYDWANLPRTQLGQPAPNATSKTFLHFTNTKSEVSFKNNDNLESLWNAL